MDFILHFVHQGEELYATTHAYPAVPRPGDYLSIGEDRYRVHAVEWQLDARRVDGLHVERFNHVNLHLRRLHHAMEWSNMDEPTGYSYATGPASDAASEL